MKNTLEYRSNNSGGSWWLSDADWQAMERAGWSVGWIKDNPEPMIPAGSDRWLGAIATRATIETTDPDSVIAEWESVTGQSASAEGCNCCGHPHEFTYYDSDGKARYSDVVVTSTEMRWS